MASNRERERTRKGNDCLGDWPPKSYELSPRNHVNWAVIRHTHTYIERHYGALLSLLLITASYSVSGYLISKTARSDSGYSANSIFNCHHSTHYIAANINWRAIIPARYRKTKWLLYLDRNADTRCSSQIWTQTTDCNSLRESDRAIKRKVSQKLTLLLLHVHFHCTFFFTCSFSRITIHACA